MVEYDEERGLTYRGSSTGDGMRRGGKNFSCVVLILEKKELKRHTSARRGNGPSKVEGNAAKRRE